MVAYQPIAIITYYLNIFQKSIIIIIIYHQKSISLESLSLWDILFIIRTSEMQQWASITAIILPSSSGKIKSIWKILLPTHLWQVETLPKTKQVWGFFFCLKKSVLFEKKCCVSKSEQNCLFTTPVQNLTWFGALNYIKKEHKNSE